MKVERLDHLVLTVANIETTAQFYTAVLGMQRVSFGEGRVALAFGKQKINLHQCGEEFNPHASAPTAGSGDLCFITDSKIETMQAHLAACGVQVTVGPVRRTGAIGPIDSLYFDDPDGNLIEVSTYALEGE
ncbi:MAG: VOC family protein [Pseudomonadota bacterium]